MNRIYFLLIVIVVALSSCTVGPNLMFKTPKGYEYAVDSTNKKDVPYIIQVEDRLELHIFSNDGFKLVDVTASSIGQGAYDEGVTYIVEPNGESKMPVIGRVVLKDLSIKDAEDLLQEKYSKYYQNPFVLLRVVSRRALVFIGDQGRGTVVELKNDHTSLFEALALAGGLTDYSKASEIKILRGDLKNPKVYHADISSIEELKNSELEIYPNDIIYVAPGGNFAKKISADIVPYVSILTSVLVLITFLNSNGK